MKSMFSGISLLALTLPLTTHASSGEISVLMAEPDKVVLTLRAGGKPVTGPCGGTYFDLKRTNQNFNELYPLLLTAFSHGWPVKIHSFPCQGRSDRNPASHAEVTNPGAGE